MRAGGREWLAAAAAFGLLVAACVDSGDKNNDNGYSPVDAGATGGGTHDSGATTPGGTQGGVTPGGTQGGVTPGGTQGGVTPGGTQGGVTPGGTQGGVDAGTPGGTQGGVTPGGTQGGADAGTPGGTDAGTPGGGVDAGPWSPPATSAVMGTGNSCSSVATQSADKCGSYYCGVNQATLTREINPSKPCGDNPAYACKASLTNVVTQCASDAQSMYTADIILGDTSGFQTAITQCVKTNAEVVANNVKETCQACFIQAAVCCASDIVNCALPCMGTTGTKACDDAQKAAGCVGKVFDCGGLPSPF